MGLIQLILIFIGAILFIVGHVIIIKMTIKICESTMYGGNIGWAIIAMVLALLVACVGSLVFTLGIKFVEIISEFSI